MEQHRPISIITAASQGLGAACAKCMADNGYTVVLMSRSDRVRDVANRLGGTGVVGSVTNVEDLSNLVQRTMDDHGRIDAVISNTGHPPKGDLLAITDDDWLGSVELLFLSVVRLARLITPHMQRMGGGAFVNISSFGARAPSLAYPTSSVIRAALTNFTVLYARSHARDRIRMNNVLPGFAENHPVDEETLARIPAGRPATVNEIANVAAFLASPKASSITGQDVLADGGLLPGW
jgi:NAD(P)-dependent dehydrogenase (short-subunit alcohol dehydrogenase family)